MAHFLCHLGAHILEPFCSISILPKTYLFLFWIFCSSHQIINANVIIVRQLDKNFSRDAACSNFIVCIAAARNLQIARKFLPA